MAKKWVCFLKDKSKPCQLVETEDKIMPSNIFADGAGTDDYYDNYSDDDNDTFIPIGSDNGGGRVGNDDGDTDNNSDSGFLGGVLNIFDKVSTVAGGYYNQKSQFELQRARIDAALINARNTGNDGTGAPQINFDEPGKPDGFEGQGDDAIPPNYIFYGGLALAALFVGTLALKKS